MSEYYINGTKVEVGQVWICEDGEECEIQGFDSEDKSACIETTRSWVNAKGVSNIADTHGFHALNLVAIKDSGTVGKETEEDTEALVIQEIQSRKERGLSKYGTTVADNPLSLKQWLQHALEEALDQAIYLKRAIQEIERKENEQV